LVKLDFDRLTHYPALFRDRLPLIVVGAVDVNGARAWYSQGIDSELDSSAVGAVVCPHGHNDGLIQKSGTSFSMI